MGPKMKLILLLLVLVLLLGGCSLMTLEELYCPPKRAQNDENLQSLIDEAMENHTYSAPISGENRQSLQKADLDGDGVDEYLLFAKDESENPLKIMIFAKVASGYVLRDTIEGYGFAFDFVQYAQMDDRDGLEIIVGRQVSDELTRSVSVYRFTSGFARQLLSTGYTGIACEDLNADGRHELVLLTAGVSERSKGVAMLYAFADGELGRSSVAYLSKPISSFQRVQSGMLEDGTHAVYVTSMGDNDSLVVDIFAIADGSLANLSKGTEVHAMRNYSVFPADIDEDGVVELPQAVLAQSVSGSDSEEYILQWFSVDAAGNRHIKAYTYHHYVSGWYLFLDEDWVSRFMIQQDTNGCVFYLRNPATGNIQKIMTILTLTDSDRESEAMTEGRIVLYKGDSIIYAADLEAIAAEYNITEEILLEIFHPIRKEWNTEESGGDL